MSSLLNRILNRLPTERLKWKHGDLAMSGGLWKAWTHDTDDDERLFLELDGTMRIFNFCTGKEIAYSKDWCKLDAEEIAWRFEYRKIGNIFEEKHKAGVA